MSPILGIWASSKAVAAADTGAMFPLQVITVGSAGASSITFTNIPNTYSHLQLRALSRSDRSLTSDSWFIQINSDTATNYSYHALRGNGTTADAFSSVSDTSMLFLQQAGGTTGANVFGTLILDILDYSNTNKNKTLRGLGGVDNNGNGTLGLSSGLWRSTSAVTSIRIVPNSGNNFVQYSSFALYGIKGA
jgi:hypothetical protein